MRNFIALTLAATALTGAVVAQDDYEQTQTTAGKPSVTLGAGVLVRPDYSGADTYDTMAIPVLAIKKELTPGNTAYLRGNMAGVDHTIDKQWSVGVMGDYRFKRDSSDSSRLRGMEDIDGAIEMGPKVRYQINPLVGIEARALFDVSDAYNGYTARLGGDFVLPVSQMTFLTVTGGLNYGSENYNDTYYGVTRAQAIPGRGAYSVGSGLTNFDVGVGVRHTLTRHWSVQGNLAADYLVGDVADSPLVDQNLQPSLMLGLAYSF